MKTSALTWTLAGAGAAARCGAAFRTFFSLSLSSVRQMRHQPVVVRTRHKNLRTGTGMPQPASSGVMLVESDVETGVHGIVP